MGHSGSDHAPGSWSVQILLPERLQAEARRLSTGWPGATWPSWGPHVTLLSEVAGSLDVVSEAVSRACSRFAPFELRMDSVVRDEHWGRPSLQTVMLVSHTPAGSGDGVAERLRSELATELAVPPNALWPESEGHSYVPHVSLTTGLPEAAACLLEDAVRRSSPSLAWLVSEVWLLAIAANDPQQERLRPVAAFPLSRRRR